MKISYLPILILFPIYVGLNSFAEAQQLSGNCTAAEKKNFQTVKKAMSWLKKHPTTLMNRKDPASMNKAVRFYDSVFTLFFDEEEWPRGEGYRDPASEQGSV